MHKSMSQVGMHDRRDNLLLTHNRHCVTMLLLVLLAAGCDQLVHGQGHAHPWRQGPGSGARQPGRTGLAAHTPAAGVADGLHCCVPAVMAQGSALDDDNRLACFKTAAGQGLAVPAEQLHNLTNSNIARVAPK